MPVHAVLFDNGIYTADKAREWLKEHNYVPIKRVHKTENYLRYRLITPKKDASYYTVNTKKGIKLVIMK